MQIPTYQKQSSLSTESPAGDIRPDMASAGGQMIAEVGKGMEGLADHFQALRDDYEQNDANIFLNKKMDEIYIRRMSQSDVMTAGDGAQDEYRQAAQEASKLISSNSARPDYFRQTDLNAWCKV